MNTACFSIWVSVGSLLVAAIALWRTIRKDRAATTHRKKALIRAKGYKKDRAWAVKVWNDGVAPARNIRFVSDDVEKDDGMRLAVRQGTFPYPLLNSGDSFEMHAMLVEGHNPVPKIKFVWDDDLGENREREQVLEFD